VPGAVALDYKTTFALEEKIVEVPVEAPEETAERGGVLNLEGIVREAGNKDPLEGVEVTIEVPKPNAKELPPEDAYDVLTATTGEDGRFEMRGVPAGSWRIDFTFSGYEPSFVEEQIADNEKTSLIVYLTPRETNRFETVIRRRRAIKDVAKVSLSRDEVKRVPGTFGDPLRVIENLPGLARAPFFGGALIVRGANPADSGVYFDGVEIPILYHFGGLTSVVNAEFLEDIAFYPGGFGAKYGRATAGIVDVTSRELKFKNFRGYAEVDLLDAGFFFAGPVKIGELPKITFAAAARRSYIDALLPLVLDAFIGPGGQGIVAAPVYWDYQAKLETRPFEGQTFSLFLFGSQDDLRVVSTGVDQSLDVGFRQTFHRLVGKWDWKINSRLQHTLQPYLGVTRFEFQAGNSGDQGPDLSASGVIDTYNWGVRDQLTYALSEKVTLRGGVDYLGQTFGVEFDLPVPLEIGGFPRQYPRLEGINQQIAQSGFNNATGLWVEAEIEALPRLKIIPGARAELTVVTFLPDEGIDGSTTKSDDVSLFHVDPRITARYELIPQTTVKAAAGVYRQPPDAQSLSDDVGNPDLVEPRAVQLIAGIEQGLTDNINLDVQLYLTNRDLLVQNTDAVRTTDDGSGDADPLLFNNGGRGRTFGAEILLRHELTQYLYGWVAYTLSRTVIDLDEDDSSYQLTDFDQTHILTVVAQTNLPYGFTLGARFRAVTGNPTSLPIGSVHDLDTTSYLSLGSSPQSTRLPAFHQLDIRVDRKFVFETFSLTAYLDLLNAYYSKNSEGFQSDFRSRELQPIPSLPILPVIGMSGEF
jgi:Carboxypeptidase regulatory-like domain/TonB-dependent Receptor Plug Domain